MRCLLTVLHWHAASLTPGKAAAPEAAAWSSLRGPALGKNGSDGKLPVKTLNVLAAFLRAGLQEDHDADVDAIYSRKWPFPLRYTEAHMLPKRSNTFVHLNLFGAPRDEDNEMYVEREERQRIFQTRFHAIVSSGVEGAKREGGEIGRAAAVVAKSIQGLESDRVDES